MTDKEKEAIEYFKKRIDICMENANICDDNDFDEEATYLRKEQILTEIVLNLIQTQQAEIEKLRNNNKDLLRKLRNRVKEVKKLTKYSLYKKEFLTLNEHLKKKDKIIDEMAKCIDIELSSSRLGIILNKNVKPLENYKKDIKQYFERKVENGN